MDVLERLIVEDVTDKGVSFEKRKNHLLGPVYRIGQRSWLPANHLIVTPSIDKTGIRPDVFYKSVEIKNHWWGGPVMATAQNTPDLQRQAAHQLASKLRAYFWSSANPETVWPQEIEVCAVCERSLQLQDGQMQCPRHGADYPTRTIIVVPFSE
ncbi:MAG TPA: hypothetical protein VF281_00960 [Candidatus Saccharimonadales bacterium]